MQVSHMMHVTLHCTQCLFTGMHSSILSLSPYAGLHTGFFYGGGGGDTHISAASRRSGGMLPQKFFVFSVGQELPVHPSPPSVCNPVMYF